MSTDAVDLDPRSGRGEPRGARSGRPPPPGLVVAALVVAGLFATPLAYLVIRNASPGAGVRATLFSRAALEPLSRTLLLAASVAAAAAVTGTALAWLVVRTDLPLRRLWRVAAPLPLVIPSFVGAAALLAAVAPGGLLAEALEPLGVDQLPQVRGFWGAFGVLTLFTYPYVYLPVAARLAALPPSLEESARLLGSRAPAAFRSVVLPQITGAIWAGALLVFLYTVSDFGAVSLLRYDTVTRAIFSARLIPDTRLALSFLLAIVAITVVVVEWALGRRRLQTPAASGIRPMQVRLGRWRTPALVLVGVVVSGALLGPVSVLGHWTLRGVANDTLDFGTTDMLSALRNTATVSVITAVIAVAVVLPVAYLTTRYRTRWGGVANAMVVSGFALPGLVTALALVFWVLQAPLVGRLYQTLPLLLFAYVAHFGAQALRTSEVALSAMPRWLDDAARVLGAGRVRRFATVELPIMLPGLLAGAGLVLLSTMKELPATLLLAPSGFSTLATEVWQSTEEGLLANSGFASLVLILLSGVLSWVLIVRRWRPWS